MLATLPTLLRPLPFVRAFALALPLVWGACAADPPMPTIFDGAGRVSFACGPTDGPAVQLEVGLTEAACDAAPADTEHFSMIVFGPSFPAETGVEMSFSDTEGGTGTWFAGPDDATGLVIESGAFTVLEDGDAGVRTGGYTFTRADGVSYEGSFSAVDCDDGTMCG